MSVYASMLAGAPPKRGLTNRQVAERLFVSQHTVSNHLRHAFAKLDVTSRVELARLVAIHDNTVG